MVVDVSGSMQQEAANKSLEAGAPRLSVLDIVKHAVKTVVLTMGPQDRLGIVAYSDRATKVLDLTAMDEAGQAAADQALASLRADGQTNLWDGLQVSMEMLRLGQRAGASAAMLLLTDGVPNVEPAGGHMAALREYRAQQAGKLPGTLHTFGFGQELDSQLLDDLATEGGGLYTFIPDAGFVGTALVNCTANTLTAVGRNVELVLKPAAGCIVGSVLGFGGNCEGGSRCTVPLGTLQLGQSKDVVVSMKAPEGVKGHLLTAKLMYNGPEGAVVVEADVVAPATVTSSLPAELAVQQSRLRFVEVVREALEVAKVAHRGLPDSSKVVEAFAAELTSLSSDSRIVALKEDVDGQVSEALSRLDWFKSWGAHYLRSLARAHLLQQCNNFKDPGVQVYGGDLFRSVRDAADDIFVALPPPAPESIDDVEMLKSLGFSEDEARRALAAAHGNLELAAQYCMEGIPAVRVPMPAATAAPRAAAPAAAAPFSMAAYYDSSGPCFCGDSLVLMADGSQVPLRELGRGDKVATVLGGEAEVQCIVETKTAEGTALLVELPSGPRVTPWHPVFLSGQWQFPAEVALTGEFPCEAVFNLVLAQGHVPCIGGVWTVSLGHGLQGSVVGHKYWGSQRVLEDLQRLKGWDAGRIVLGAGCVVRGGPCGEACGLR